MQKLRQGIDKVLAWAVIALMGIAVLNVLWQVFTRWVLRDPSSYTEELARYLLIWVGLLGASYAAGKKLHLAIDLIPSKLEGKARHYLELVIEACIFFFALFVMAVGGTRLVALTLYLGQTSAALGIALGYVYLVIPLSGILIMFYTASFMIDRFGIMAGKQKMPIERGRPASDSLDKLID